MTNPASYRHTRGVVALLLLALLLTACSTAPRAVAPLPEGDFRARIQTQQQDGVRLSAGVPSSRESKDIFNKPLYKMGIQPVWLEIENHRDTPITMLPVGLDPEYFTPLEVANLDSGDSPPEGLSLVDRFFMDKSLSMAVAPGKKISGFIFTRLDEGTKSFNVDVAGAEGFVTFTFFIPVPGLDIDHYSVDWEHLYPPEQITAMNDEQLVEALEALPCCTSNKSGSAQGDPLNLVVIGTPIDVYVAFLRAGWDETEVVTRASAWKTIRSFLGGAEYRYSPVSSLYALGRAQDVALQKARQSIHERNHLRLWMLPLRYQGLPVWIGQISRDIGVRFTLKTITTHKIDPDVDETREYILEDLAYAQALRKGGYVGGVGAVSPDAPAGNLTGDLWYSDGYRLVLWVTSRPTAISEVRRLEWRTPYDVH